MDKARKVICIVLVMKRNNIRCYYEGLMCIDKEENAFEDFSHGRSNGKMTDESQSSRKRCICVPFLRCLVGVRYGANTSFSHRPFTLFSVP